MWTELELKEYTRECVDKYNISPSGIVLKSYYTGNSTEKGTIKFDEQRAIVEKEIKIYNQTKKSPIPVVDSKIKHHNYKVWHYYIQAYIGEFPCYLIHEISHWIIALFTMIVGYNTFPKIVIQEWYSIKEIEDDYTKSNGFFMYVNYGTYYENRFLNILISTGPAIVTIILLLISPWWLNLYWLCNISPLWLSVGDYNGIKKELEIK